MDVNSNSDIQWPLSLMPLLVELRGGGSLTLESNAESRDISSAIYCQSPQCSGLFEIGLATLW